jgi:hypothetical protein
VAVNGDCLFANGLICTHLVPKNRREIAVIKGSILAVMKTKIAAAIQILFVLLVIGFGTYQLYQGNFEASIATMPFLIIYYLFVTARQKRIREEHAREDGEDEELPR